MLKVHQSTDRSRQRAAVAIIGDPGAGKTMLAGTAPNAFFLDVEGRASHAGCPYVVPQQNAAGYQEVAEVISTLSRQPLNEDGTVSWQDLRIGTIVLDTVDHLQGLCKLKYVNEYNKQRMYGKLLEDMMNHIVWPMMGVPVNLVMVFHTRSYGDAGHDDSRKKQDSENGSFPRVDLALEGDLRNKLMRYFDNVLHLVVAQTGEHKIVTSPRVLDGRFLVAKDTLWLLNGETIGLTWRHGKPETKALTKIFDQMLTARHEAQTVGAVKSEWIAAAHEMGILKDSNDAAGIQALKDLLGDTYVELAGAREDTVARVREQGLAKIRRRAQHSGKPKVDPPP